MSTEETTQINVTAAINENEQKRITLGFSRLQLAATFAGLFLTVFLSVSGAYLAVRSDIADLREKVAIRAVEDQAFKTYAMEKFGGYDSLVKQRDQQWSTQDKRMERMEVLLQVVAENLKELKENRK